MAWAMLISIFHLTTYKRQEVAEGFILLSSAVRFLSPKIKKSFLNYVGSL
jgi:hypothetical protein